MRHSRKININVLEGLSPVLNISEAKKAKRVQDALYQGQLPGQNFSTQPRKLVLPGNTSLAFEDISLDLVLSRLDSWEQNSSPNRLVSLLESYIQSNVNSVNALTQEYNTAKENEKAFKEKHSFVLPDIDYSKECCTLCHNRGHNRKCCPNKNSRCTTAKTCGDLSRHPEERDQLRDLKLHR